VLEQLADERGAARIRCETRLVWLVMFGYGVRRDREMWRRGLLCAGVACLLQRRCLGLNTDLSSMNLTWIVPPVSCQGPRRRMNRRLVVLVVAVTVCLGLPSGALASSAADTAATRAYLQARYAWYQAVAANLPASMAATEAFAAKIGGECAGVLAGVPLESRSPSSAKRFGEFKRETEQLGDLEEELSFTLESPGLQPDHQATLALVSTAMSLSWSSPTLTRQVHLDITEFEEQREQLERNPPAVCADMKTWVSSGYETLSAGTKQFVRQREAPAGAPGARRQSIVQLLAPYEGPEEKAIIKQTFQIERQIVAAEKPLRVVYERLQRAVGLTPNRLQSGGEPPAGSVVIGKGRTASGGKYVVTLLPAEPSNGARRPGCKLPITIRGPGGGLNECLDRSSSPFPPSVNCQEGLLTINARTLPRARRVRLRLSDGRQITSAVTIVPASRAGSADGVYYQVVRGSSPIPVLLAELDGHGRTLRVFKLPRVSDCTKPTLKFLPGGLRKVVHSRVPGGPAFSIIGQHYSFLGHDYFELSVETELGGGGESPRGKNPGLFAWHLWTGCRPHPYMILYGLLKAPGDSVYARTSGKLSRLRRVAIPKSLHAGGVLVYTVSPTVPGELLVRGPGGRTILTEKLGHLAAEATETCQGEEESKTTPG
jgi:hypothetical protein